MATPTIDELPTVIVTSSAAFQGVRQPRAIVKVGAFGAGVAVSGWRSWTVSNNSFYEADTFHVSFAASTLPSSNDVNWFFSQKEAFVEILAGFPTHPDSPDPSELQSLIYGRIDDIEYDPVEALIIVTGRDLTAVFIDNKIAAEYFNKFSSQVAQALVDLHPGMTGQITDTVNKSPKVGTYYDTDQLLLVPSRSEWDVLTYLARKEAFVVYVQGTTLYFGPNPTGTGNIYDIVWQPPTADHGSPISNVIELSFSRSMTVAKGVTVTARSASFTTGKPVVQSYPSNPKAIQAGKASPFGDTVNYYVNMSANHSPVEVEAFAKAQYDAIVSHEMKLKATLPGDNLLTIQTPIEVSGTGTDLDQTYYPRLVTREMSLEDGYQMTVEAQNVSPNATPEE